jgi:signal transduction histidine kinase
MDRAHVLSKSFYGNYQLSGVFASFPSDMNGEIKRFGLRIGKFQMGNDELYQRNRNFVMQYLMELYGFPIASERRTSAALFSRRLHKAGENFLIRVLGQSDRVITTIWNDHLHSRYPSVEKITLVSIDKEQAEIINEIKEHNAFVDEKKRVIILRTLYKQHAFNKGNVRQDRALSIMSHEIIHPLTGKSITNINVLRSSTNLIIRLNDIIRGEYYGTVIYKKTELIENTDTEEKRLKFLYTWLSKHQRRIISYSDEFFLDLSKILEAYLTKLNADDSSELRELVQENLNKYSFILQARKVRVLEEISTRKYKDKTLNYEQMITEALNIAKELRLESIHYFETIIESTLYEIDRILNNRYLLRNYIEKSENQLTARGLEIKKNYGKLIAVRDEIVSIQKSHTKSQEFYSGF